MATPQVIDIDSLTVPISDVAPTGEALNSNDWESSLVLVRDAREDAIKAERALEDFEISPENEEDSPPERPDWKKVIGVAAETLQYKSKDARVAGWLAESLVREHGYAGIRDGLGLCRQLCEKFWDGLHPLPTPEDGHYYTGGAFESLATDTMINVLRAFPVTATEDGIGYTMIDYDQEGAVPFDTFQQAVRSTSREFYADMVDDLQQSVEHVEAIGGFLEEHCQPESTGEKTAPSMAGFRSKLSDLLSTIRLVAKDHLGEPPEDGTAGMEEGALATGGGEGGAMSQARVTSRSDALKAIEKLADFFERSEPHSPMSFALRQIAGWGDMSLPELLRELIRDDSVREDLERRTGVPKLERKND